MFLKQSKNENKNLLNIIKFKYENENIIEYNKHLRMKFNLLNI